TTSGNQAASVLAGIGGMGLQSRFGNFMQPIQPPGIFHPAPAQGIPGKMKGLASGGIVTRPTMTWIGEQYKPEAVIPLSRMREFTARAETAGGRGDITIHAPVTIHASPGTDVAAIRQ